MVVKIIDAVPHSHPSRRIGNKYYLRANYRSNHSFRTYISIEYRASAMEINTENILQLQPTMNQIEGQKRKLSGYNVFLSRFFTQFEDRDEDDKRELLCKSNTHCANDYIVCDEDSSVTKSSTDNIDIIRLALWR